jgi:hypothetical protein
MGYRLDGQGSIPGRARDFPVVHSIQTDSEAHSASYPIDTGALSLGVK